MLWRTRTALTIGFLCMAIAASLPADAAIEAQIWKHQYRSGRAAAEKGNVEKAEKKLRAALREAEAFGRCDPRLAATQLELAGVLGFDSEEGRKLVSDARGVLERSRWEDNVYTARSLAWLGRERLFHEDHAGAIPVLKRSLAVYKNAEVARRDEMATVESLLAEARVKAGTVGESK